jgi:hypothetical protein
MDRCRGSLRGVYGRDLPDPHKLLKPKRPDWVNTDRTPRRNKTYAYRHHQQKHRYDSDREGITRADAEQLTRQESSNPKGANQTRRKPTHDWQESLPKHHRDQLTPFRAQRQSDPNLRRPSGDSERNGVSRNTG